MASAAWTDKQLEAQYYSAKKTGIVDLLEEAAEDYAVPLAFVLAIASRETGIRNIEGDGGMGIGVIQIDTRWHTIAAEAKRTGSWKTKPYTLVRYGVKMLFDFISRANGSLETTSYSPCLIAACAYNRGWGGMLEGVREHGDPNAKTAHGDYGNDVMKRTEAFQRLLEEKYRNESVAGVNGKSVEVAIDGVLMEGFRGIKDVKGSVWVPVRDTLEAIYPDIQVKWDGKLNRVNIHTLGISVTKKEGGS